MSLSLNCLVDGDAPDQVFTVKIPPTENVSILKDMIKERVASRFNHIDALDLDLRRVSIPVDDLEKELGNLHLSGCPKLSPGSKKLSTFFTDIDDDYLHVMIARPPEVQKTVQALGSTQLLSLNCFVLGDDPDRVFFTVEIPPTKNVSILKDMIKEKQAPSFNDIPASKLDLWKVSFPIDDLLHTNPNTVGPRLNPQKLLSDLFSSTLDINHVHIVVRPPVQGAHSLRSAAPPTAYKLNIISTEDVGRNRAEFCVHRQSDSPSNGGKPQEFLSKQKMLDGCIPCNRPHSCPTALSLSLLHPAFGEFVDDAENYEPTPDDAKLFVKFVKAMVNLYTDEAKRQAALLKIFNEHQIPIQPTKFNGFSTAGDLSCGKFRYLFVEFKNEIGSSGAEPYFQSILYFLEATREFAAEHVNSVLPCIVVLIFGPYIAFAGAAWTDRPIIQMLSPAIPCHYQNTDIRMESMLMRHLGALRRAISSLDAYYQRYNANPNGPLRNPNHPYPTTFTSPDGSVKQFRYLSHREGHPNLFFGRMADGNDEGTAICIKFVARYFKEGHEFLADKGFAPKLHVVERLPGGLYMVIMDDVSEEYVSLFNLIQRKLDLLKSEEYVDSRTLLSKNVRECLQQFHQAGFVHGDIRDTNIMVKAAGFQDGSFLLVDYDFCGKTDQVRYPFDLNTTSVRRPEGATGGAVVEQEHDFEMLDYIWNP